MENVIYLIFLSVAKAYNHLMISRRFVRFCIVGVVNTLVDIVLFLILRRNHVDLVVANIISTSVALIVSLFLNYSYTFKETGKLTKTKLLLYIAITLVGLWILQPIVISLMTRLNETINYVNFISNMIGHKDTLINLIPKLAATAVTLVWNFTLYGKFVFSSDGNDQRIA